MKYIFLIFISLFIISSFAQAEIVKGRVWGLSEDGIKKPLPRATISAIGEASGAISDKEGNFELTVSEKVHNIVISYVGFKKDTIHIHDYEDELEIILQPNLQLGVVNVDAQKEATQVSLSSAVKMESINARGLQKAACCNLAESFEVSPSVDVEYTDAVSGAKRIQLLGLAGVYSQLLVEKVPALRGLGGIYGLAYIPGPWMDAIQVSKGAASVTTGYESMTGQINIEFKKPENADPTLINLYADEMGRGEINLTHTEKVSDNLSTMLLAHGNYFNTKFDYNKDGFIDRPLVSQANIMNRWKYQAEGYESVTGLKALVEDREGGQKNYFLKDDPTMYGIRVKTQRYEFFTKNGFIFNDEPFSSLGTIVSVSHHKQNSFFGKRDYDGEQNSFYTNLLYQFEPIEEHGVTTGFSYQYDNYIEKFDTISSNRYESIPGVFTEWTFTGVEDLTVMAGLRADFPNEFKTFITPRFHVKYSIDELTTVRASAGKGYRIPHIFAEHTGLLASARDISILDKLKPEEAWNYGLNASTIVDLFGMGFTFNAEYYRTDFLQQVVVDLDQNPDKAVFYNLDGKSYSNSFQFDTQFEPLSDLILTLAYRLNDVKTTYQGKLEDKPLQSRHKGFFNAMYDTPEKGWNFDFTLEYNGGGRMPNTDANPAEYRLDKDFPDFVIMNAQITKRFKGFDLYLGGENLTDFVQKNPILAAELPFSKNFDSSLIWGPVVGRMFYMGLRLTI